MEIRLIAIMKVKVYGNGYERLTDAEVLWEKDDETEQIQIFFNADPDEQYITWDLGYEKVEEIAEYLDKDYDVAEIQYGYYKFTDKLLKGLREIYYPDELKDCMLYNSIRDFYRKYRYDRTVR